MRSVAFIFALFYFVSSVGYGLEIHFCLGRISDMNHVLFETQCPCEAHGSSLEEPACCDEKSFFNRIEDEHHAPVTADVTGSIAPRAHDLFWNGRWNSPRLEPCSSTMGDRGPPVTIDRVIAFHRLIFYG